MKKIQSYETELVGNWFEDGDEVKGDKTCERIDWLINNVLKEIGYSKKYGAWETLYEDPEDGRYWLKIYPKSHIHGGGPPTLKTISKKVVEEDFDLHNKL
jgi:hypothetical protein